MAVQQLWQRWTGLSRIQRWSILAICSLLMYTAFGFWLLPAVVRAQLEKKLSQALHRQTTVREIQFNPFTLEAAVNGFQVLEPDGGEPFAAFDRLHVNLQAVSLFKRAIIAKSFSLLNPYARIVLNRNKTFNFSDLAAGDGGEKQDREKEEKEKPFLFSVNNIEVLGGGIDFTDRPKEAEHHVTDLHIGLPFLSNLPYEIEIFTRPVFEAVINGTPVSMLGESKPFHMTRESEINVDFRDIDLTAYLVYLPDNLNFTIKNGRLDLDLSLSFIQHEDGNPAINIRGKTSLREMQMVNGLEQPLLSFPELTVDIERLHLLRREFHLARILWREPELFVERGEDGQFNLALLVSTPAGKKEQPATVPPGGGLLFEVAETALEGGVIHFTDRTVSGRPMQSTLRPVNLRVRGFSTAPGTPAACNLALTSESGEKVGVSGTFTLAPLQVAADATVENLRPGKYRPYYEHALPAQPEAETVRAAAHIDYAGDDGSLLISGLGLELGGVSITGPDGADTVAIPAFSINGAEVNIRNRTVTVDRCESRGAVIPVIRRGDGTINLRDFLAAAPAEAVLPEEASKNDAAPPPAWQASVKAVDFADFEVTFTDRTTKEPVVLTADQLRLTADNATTIKGGQTSVDLGLRLNGSGSVRAAGSVVLSPLALQLDAELTDLPLKSVQPYMEQQLNIILAEGLGAAAGKVSLDRRADDGFAITFQGDAGISGVSVLAGAEAEKLLGWDAVRVAELNVQTGPTRIKAGDILLDGVTASVTKNPDGALNLAALMRKDEREKQADEPAGEQTQPEVEIARVRLMNCRFDFADRSINPGFSTSLAKIAGDIKGLSSSRDASAEVNITAALDQHSPVRISGSIHPWQEFFTDVTAEFNDIELPPVSPYTIKYIGHPLTRGKLSLNLHYLVEGRELTSRNRAFIDQIALGDVVPNDTAVNLPVQLAISLLKNRRGEIDLDIPVSGRLDDPEFSVAGVVFKMLANLIVKAATSPFSLLGAVFEGGGKEQYIDFAAGSASIGAEALEKLTEFAKVLYDRPAIKVEITGRVDPAADGDALAQARFERLLKVQKLKEPAKKKEAAADLDAIVIAADEYEYYLEKAYKAADFERPRNFLGMLKDIPAGEMEALLREHIVITGDDLRELAVKRAGAVRDVLVEKGPVEPERIFLVEPRGGYAAAGEAQPDTRVEISLR